LTGIFRQIEGARQNNIPMATYVCFRFKVQAT